MAFCQCVKLCKSKEQKKYKRNKTDKQCHAIISTFYRDDLAATQVLSKTTLTIKPKP